MKLEKIGLWVGIVAGVVAIWYYLRDTPDNNLVTYPNTQASGQPASQNPATTYNIAAPSPMPSPNLIYGPTPPLPPTPAYQSFNYSPLNILGLTPQGAAATTVDTPAATDKKHGDCCCNECASCAGGGIYQDSGGGGNACLVANPKEQITNAPPALFQKLQANIDSSSVGPNGGPIPPAPAPSPVQSAKTIPSQAQGLAQGQAGVSPASGVPPSLGRPLLTWLQFETLTAINSGA